MNIVLYTDDMEPITVIRTPFTPKQLLAARVHYFSVPVILLPRLAPPSPSSPTISDKLPIVEIWMERFVRKDIQHWFFFTKDEEAALMLRSEPLPGQRKELQEQYQRGFAEGFASALWRVL